HQQHQQGFYPAASTTPAAPFPQPSPTFTPNEYYQQQQHQQHVYSPIVTTTGISHQEPMPMPEQSNPYGLTSPTATQTSTAYSPAMTAHTNSTTYDAQTPASSAAFVMPAVPSAYEAPASTVNAMNKASTHGPQALPTQEQAAMGLPKNPQYVEPYHNTTYHN
ncbi:hypothetical protein BGZ95_003013, partial [Linnemannia exigua]